jgi:hypothetical protein
VSGTLKALLVFLRHELTLLLEAAGRLHTDHGIHGHRDLKPPS